MLEERRKSARLEAALVNYCAARPFILPVFDFLAEESVRFFRDMLSELVVEAYESVSRTPDLLPVLKENGVVVAPSKAVNAGGVAVSGLEMSQNSERLSWTEEEVDAQLQKMMINIHKVSAEDAEQYGLGYNLVAGANLAGFKKVATAMMEQGAF